MAALEFEREQNRQLLNSLFIRDGLVEQRQDVIVPAQKAVPGYRPWNKVKRDLEKAYWRGLVDKTEQFDMKEKEDAS